MVNQQFFGVRPNMKFSYFYPLREDEKQLRFDLPIHLLEKNEEIYLCGEPLLKGPHIIADNAKPGLKLCEICVEERRRLKDGKPSSKQMKNWWTGGLTDFRNEIKANSSR